MTESLDDKVLREMREVTCAGCGGFKQVRVSFCTACRERLPMDLHLALYRTFGGGYTQAYVKASEWLRENAGASGDERENNER